MMQWNLRMIAAQRGVWKAADLRRLLAEAGLQVSVGKMSHLWSGTPISVRLDDLDVICAVLECTPGELLLPDPPEASSQTKPARHAAQGASPAIRPSKGRKSRSLPPA
jgi:DNA-binding Xre family transcriptional regulator